MSKIHLYAEVLTNIRQVSLYAALQTTKNEGTKIDISSDKKIVTVLHDGQSTSIYLPTEISGTAQVEIPTEKKKELTVRLSIEDTSSLRSSGDDTRGIEAPWPAQDLSLETAAQCNSCKEIILKAGKVGVWQDLPSENWYEMMDYWHCDKPHETSANEHDQVADSKGYAAASRVITKAGTGFVDVSCFLLDGRDCTNLKVVPTPDPHDADPIHCRECGVFVGWHDSSVGGHRLHKSRLLVQPNASSQWETWPAATFICAQLLALIEAQATRKFVFHSGGRSGYIVWVFNPDIHYSSSTRGPIAHRAIKLLYKSIMNPTEMLDANSTTLEELRLPLPLLEAFEEALLDGGDVLPQSARYFQDWKVAILDRYEKHASMVMDHNMLTKKASPVFAWPERVDKIEGIEALLE